MHEAARNQVGSRDDFAGVLVDRHDDDEDSVLRQHAPVPEHDRADIAHTEAVDEDIAGGYLVPEMRHAIAHLDVVAVIGDDDAVRRDADLLGDFRMQREMTKLAMDRHEELRPHQVQHQLQLLAAGVTRGVHPVSR